MTRSSTFARLAACNFAALLAWAGPVHAQNTVIVTTNTVLGCSDTSLDGLDVIVDGAELVVECAHVFNSLTVRSGGTVTHPMGDSRGLDLVILGGLTIQPGGSVLANGRGHAAGQGVGAGVGGYGPYSGGGAGHGGAGATSGGGRLGGVTYGSIEAPASLGSGGGHPGISGFGGSGGGRLRLVIGGVLAVDGTLAANGVDGFDQGGGGAGGSIWIDTLELTGTGSIQANGGRGGGYQNPSAGGGAGGGGRISIGYRWNFFAGELTACGLVGGMLGGGAGTIYLRPEFEPNLLLIDNCGTVRETTEMTGAVFIDANVVVSGGAVLGHDHGDNSLSITVAGDLTVESGAMISTDGRGFGAADGPGRGADGFFTGAGAGHGNVGGQGCGSPFAGAPGGIAYGQANFPNRLGSGGGYGFDGPQGGTPGAGGGKVVLSVSGDLRIDGRVSADGRAGIHNAGGGSGGSVRIVARSLSGLGTISADGGNGGGYPGASGATGGGGAGGRVYVAAQGAQSIPVSVSGGGSSNCGLPGGAGTVVIECPGVSRYCTANPTPQGPPARIDWIGSQSASQNNVVLLVSNAPSSTFGLFFYGLNRTSTPGGDGVVCVGAPFYRLTPVQADIFGLAQYSLDLNSPPTPTGSITPGTTWNFQFWFRQTSPSGFNFSDALTIPFCN